MISERQKAFRQEYRSRIIGWYDGYVHVVIIYAMGAAAFYIYVEHIYNVTWLEWLTVPLTFLFTNMFEWAVHRFIMHRPVNIKGLRSVYERHTLNHHQFFTDEEMRFRDNKDWRVTVFPPYALVVFILMSIPMAAILGLLLTPNVGWLFMCVTTGMYLIYEFMHFCCHVDENWFVRNMPFVNTLRRHHTAHHNGRLMMEVNMNLTFPIADWLFGTSDLDRGLLGHLFNGYDTGHLKTKLRGRPKRPDEAAAAPMGNYLGRRHAERRQSHCLGARGDCRGHPRAIGSGSPIRPEYGTFVMATAVFMVIAMWIFPEAGGKKRAPK